MEKISKKTIVLVGLMLFSMFFGAGNLIFPPFLGYMSGSKFVISLIFFLLSAVGFPLLGIIVVTKCNGLDNLSSRVSKSFALIFNVLVYLSIGPLLAIPRACTLPYEIAFMPLIPDEYKGVGLLIFAIIFFSFALWFSYSRSKVLDRFGKILTPVLLALIVILFVGSLIYPVGGFNTSLSEYQSMPAIKGFLEGYLTMDTIASLNFGIVILYTFNNLGVKDNKKIINATIKSALIAGMLLAIVYVFLAIVGATSGNLVGINNGANVLTQVTYHIFGNLGIVILAAIFILACITTCVGLIMSCSEYFSSLTPKFSYNNWIMMITVSSIVTSNFGLDLILSISVSILNVIYPIAMTLILLGLVHDKLKLKHLVYQASIFTCFVVSFINEMTTIFKLAPLKDLLNMIIPLNKMTLGWVLPTIIVFTITYFMTKNKKEEVFEDEKVFK